MKPLLCFMILLTIAPMNSMALSIDLDADKYNARTLKEAQELRAAADKGDADAMFRLSMHLKSHAPYASKIVYICNGVKVSPFARKKLEAQGKDCKSDEDEKNNARIEKWKAVGFKGDSDYWFNKAAENGSPYAVGIKCAIGKDLSKRVRKFCDLLSDNKGN